MEILPIESSNAFLQGRNSDEMELLSTLDLRDYCDAIALSLADESISEKLRNKLRDEMQRYFF